MDYLNRAGFNRIQFDKY